MSGKYSNFMKTAGTVLGSGITPAGDFALIDAHDVQVNEEGGRLSDVFDSLNMSVCGHTWANIKELTKLLTAEDCVTNEIQCCSNCGMMRRYRADSHDYVLTNNVNATCTTKGTMTYTCRTCNDSYTEFIAALGHSWTTVAAQDPTNNSVGWYEYKKCSLCGETDGYVERPRLAYAITYNLTGCTLSSGASEIVKGETKYVTIVANDGYTLAESALARVAVTGCTHSITVQTDSAITLALSNPTNDIKITVMAMKKLILDPIITYNGNDSGDDLVTHYFTVTNNNSYAVSCKCGGGSYNQEYNLTIPAQSSETFNISSNYSDCYFEAQFTGNGMTSNLVSGEYSDVGIAEQYDVSMIITKDGTTPVASCLRPDTTIAAGETNTYTVMAASDSAGTPYVLGASVNNADYTFEEGLLGNYTLKIFNATGNVTITIRGLIQM